MESLVVCRAISNESLSVLDGESFSRKALNGGHGKYFLRADMDNNDNVMKQDRLI